MDIYKNVLNKKVKFPNFVSRDAESLIKHLLEKNIEKRYGNLQFGSKDVMNHRFFNSIDWALLE